VLFFTQSWVKSINLNSERKSFFPPVKYTFFSQLFGFFTLKTVNKSNTISPLGGVGGIEIQLNLLLKVQYNYVVKLFLSFYFILTFALQN
jgi:hypothetical protein